MAETAIIICSTLVACLVFLPLRGDAVNIEEELAQLKELVKVLEAQIDTKVEISEVADLAVRLNDTSDLEARVTVLEEDVADLTDEVDDIESVNILQDQRLLLIESDVFDNENDIEDLEDITGGLTAQVTSLEADVTSLDQRVDDLESGGGGSGNITELEVRVETLEEVTSQLTDDVSSLELNDVTQDERISSIEEDVTSLDQRVEDLESGGGGGNGTDYKDSIFMAVLTVSQTSEQDPLIFDDDVINPDGHYSTTTGKYTVPYDGIYQFSVHLTAYDSSGGVYFYLRIDDDLGGSHVDFWGGELYRVTTILLELEAGQTVHVGVNDGVYGDITFYRSYFSGYLVSTN